MKKANVFGAVLCSAALAMGMALPAFAAGEEKAVVTIGNAGDFTKEGIASTIVNGVVVEAGDTPIEEEMIKATVPLSVTIALQSQSGEFDVVPSPGKYAISNTGTSDIELTGIQATTSGAWELIAADGNYAVQSSSTGKDHIALTVGGYDVSSTSAITDATIMAGTSRAMDIDGGTELLSGKTLVPDTYNGIVVIKYTVTKA